MFAVRAQHAFDGVRFLDGGATVLIEGDRIVAVEPARHDPPDGVPVTTYDGTLLPGLVDSHVHLVADGSPGSLERAGTHDDGRLDEEIARSLHLQVIGGVTTVVDLGDSSYRTLAFRDRAEPGVPRILAAGPPLTVPAGHCHYLGGVVDGVDDVRSAVAERAERGVDVVKVMATGGMLTPGSDVLGVQFSSDELRCVVESAHDADLRVLAHAHSLAGAWHALAAGVDGLEHFTCLTDEGMQTPDELLEAIAAADVVVDATLGTDGELIPPLAMMPPHIRELVLRLSLTPEDVRAARADQLARVRRRGITVVTGVDAGATPSKPHGICWRAVVQLAECGYPVDEALATATSVPARTFGLAEETGSLRAGLSADVLVVDGDLRRDIEALGRPRAVLARGAAPGPAMPVPE